MGSLGGKFFSESKNAWVVGREVLSGGKKQAGARF